MTRLFALFTLLIACCCATACRTSKPIKVGIANDGSFAHGIRYSITPTAPSIAQPINRRMIGKGWLWPEEFPRSEKTRPFRIAVMPLPGEDGEPKSQVFTARFIPVRVASIIITQKGIVLIPR